MGNQQRGRGRETKSSSGHGLLAAITASAIGASGAVGYLYHTDKATFVKAAAATHSSLSRTVVTSWLGFFLVCLAGLALVAIVLAPFGRGKSKNQQRPTYGGWGG